MPSALASRTKKATFAKKGTKKASDPREEVKKEEILV